jgi:anti-anti-sigma factor
MVVDLTEVTFLASAGLQILLEHEQRCRDIDIDLRVVVNNRSVVRTIVLTGLTEVLGVRASLAEALEPSV